MLIDTLLRGLVVVGRGGQNIVNARARRDFLRLGDGFARVVRRGASHDGHTTVGGLDGQVNHAQPLVVQESRRLAGSAAWDQEVDAGLHLPAHQVAQGGLINASILLEGSYEGGAASTQFHDNRIILYKRNCIASEVSTTDLRG